MQKARIWPLLGALLGAGLCSPVVQAQSAEQTPKDYPPCDTAPDDASMQAAQGAFQAGNASFNEADYPRAIFYWEDAYRRDCTAHAMLKNLARAYELNEQLRHAIHALQTYLDRAPNSGEEEAIARRIENLERKLAEREREAAAALAKPPERAPEPRPERKPPPPPSEQPSDEGLDFGDESEEEEQPGRSVVPLVIAGIGGAAGILGGVQWAIARQDELDAEADCGDGGRAACLPEAKAAGNDAIDRQVVWGVVGAAGAVVAVGGLIWYFVQDDPSASDEYSDDYARVSPQLGTDFAGVSLSGSF